MKVHEQTTHRRSRRSAWPAVLTGAVYGWVATGLASLLLAAYFLIGAEFHLFVCVYSLIGVPVLTLTGTLLGACGGFVYGLLRRRRNIPEHHSRSIGPLVLRGTLIFASGAALILIGTVIWAVIAHRPIARLESLGGYLDRSATVSFMDGTLGDDDLPAVTACLNDVERYWYFLDLSNTRVSGGGLGHLQEISHDGYLLQLSSDQLDGEGTNHLGELTNIDNLWVVGHVARETREEVQRALPNVRYIGYMENEEQFRSFRGYVDTINGSVSFEEGALSNDELPAVIDRLNNLEWDWHHLSLNNTQVSGSGLRHLQGVSHPNYVLVLSSDQLDDDGLNQLGELTNIDSLCVVGHVPTETREKVQQALPNVPDIDYAED